METNNINITGKAYDAKSGAIIITDEGQTYYLEGIDYWPDAISGKTVKVSGYIKQEFFDEKDLVNEKGEYTQGMSGEKLSIQKARWELVEE